MTDDPADFGSGFERGDRVRVITQKGDLPYATVIEVDPVFGDDGSWRGDLIRVEFDGHSEGEGRGSFSHVMLQKLSAIERLGDVAEST